MDQLYRKTKSSIDSITTSLGQLEKAQTENEFKLIRDQLKVLINDIHTSLDRLDLNLNKEIQVQRKSEFKLKIDQLKYDLKHLKSSFNLIDNKKEQFYLQEKQREELLARSYTLNNRDNNNVDTKLILDHELNELEHTNRLRNTNKSLDDMINHASNIFENLQHQNSILKSTKNRIEQIFNSLGLSNTVIQLISRRSNVDKKIVFILMILTCIIMFLTIKYLI